MTNENFVKQNICPYCTYFCDSAMMLDGNDKPVPGCISICLMCAEPSEWNDKMDLVKFDINSLAEFSKNEMESQKLLVNKFWEQNPGILGKREKYLEIFNERKWKGK